MNNKIIKEEEIIKIFLDMSNAPFKSLLLRNTENELPANLCYQKDIDFLVKINDRQLLNSYLIKLGYLKIKHPWDLVPKDNFITPFDYYLHNSGAILDINYQLVHCDFGRTKFVPHRLWLQKYVWRTYKMKSFGKLRYFYISSEVEVIISSIRCLLDKRKMTQWNFERIIDCFKNIRNKKIVIDELNHILGDYSKFFLNCLINNKWDNSIINYIKSNY